MSRRETSACSRRIRSRTALGTRYSELERGNPLPDSKVSTSNLIGSGAYRHPMERGGPEVTAGLSPRTRSYSRMFTWPNLMPLFCDALVRDPRWRDSWRVREIMMDRIGLDSMASESARIKTVGAESFMRDELEEERRRASAVPFTV